MFPKHEPNIRRKLNVPWTSEEDVVIRQMAAANKSVMLIAARMGRSALSIRNRALFIGVKLEKLVELRRRLGLTRKF